MKKSILIVLIVLLAFILMTVVTYAKAKREEVTQRQTYFQKAMAGPGPEEFPEVVLPRAKPARPTSEDFQNVLAKKGWTKEKAEAMWGDDVPMGFESEEKAPFYCTIRNQEGSAFYRPGGDANLYCWGQLGIATFMDLDHNYYADCPYPLYPFQAVEVGMQVYATDSCTIVSEARIYSADYSGGGPYPDQMLCTSDQANPLVYSHEGAFAYIIVPLDTPNCCLYEPFFGVFLFDNSDDYNDTDYCTPIYFVDLTVIFDASGRKYQSYWGPYMEVTGEPYYGWFDVVTNGLWTGAVRVQVYGFTADQNACPEPPDTWYFKEPYGPAAPCGIPDFDQNQMPGPAFCGPTAGANSIWWFAARGDFPPSWGGLTPADPPVLIGEIADIAGTTPEGTECDSLQKAIIDVIKAHGGWWFEETTVYAPDFWYIQKELRDCEDVVLLLGFWQTPDGGTTWQRFGGHFVTLAGIDIYNLAFAFSDPARDAAEIFAGPGTVCGTHYPPNDPLDHNSGITSYDYFLVAWPSESPGGFLWLPDYLASWPDFQDQNFRTEHIPYKGIYNDTLPVIVEVEQAIVVSPGSKEMSGEIESSRAYEVDNNHGGIAESFQVNFGAGLVEGGYYGSFILGTEQADLNCDYGDYYPVETFDASASPALDTFVVTGSAGDYNIYQLTLSFAHKFIPDLEITEYVFGFWVPLGGVENCEYVIEHVFVLHNTGATDIIGLQTGVINDYDIGTNNLCDVDYDQQHQSVWMWETTVPGEVFGMTKKPAVAGDVAVTGWGLKNDGRIYDGEYHDSLKYWMENLGWGVDEPGTFDDKSLLIADNSFDLPAGGYHIEKWLKWGYPGTIAEGGDASWRHFLYDVLHQEGYFRGDVNRDKKLSLTDIVYLIGYLLKSGPEPDEFLDQGDVNNDGNVDISDIVYLINFLYKRGSAPIDKNRFLLESPFVDPAHKTLGIRDPGLFGEPDWTDLGQ